MKLILKGSLAASFLAASLALPYLGHAQDYTIDFGGRYMLDYTVADISGPDSKIRDEEIRRLRAKVSGKLGSKWSYKVETTIDTESDGLNLILEDAYVQFKPGIGNWAFVFGQDNTTVSMLEQESSLHSGTYERAAFTDAFGFSRRLGVIAKTSGDNYSFSAGVFSSNLEGEGGGSTDNGKAASAHATYNPIKTDDKMVHLGAYWRYRDKGDDSSDLRYRQRPFTHVAPSRIINTGRFAKSDNTFGLEAAAIAGRFWAASEVSLLKANGSGTNPDADFSGFSGEAGVFFGGQKGYKGNKFTRPKVDKPFGQGGLGAVSFIAHYDNLDLQDAVYTGKLDTFVLGADWWPTSKTRVGVNYFNADAENGSADKGEGFVARAQFEF